MTIELNREAIARIAALPGVAEAAEAGSALISLWPLTEAMQMDNDAKYAENLQVRVTHAFARILTGRGCYRCLTPNSSTRGPMRFLAVRKAS